MKKHFYKAGSIALALAMSGWPAALAHAEDASNSDAVTVSVGQTEAGASTTMRVRREAENQIEDQNEATSSERVREAAQQRAEQVREVAQQQGEKVREMIKQRIEFMREGTTASALSLDQLKQIIKERRQELDSEEASTTPNLKNVMKNANEVRLAVHTLLASKELLGGIGPQVSEIAKHMNDSLATTTNAEAQIESRGFLTKLLFGGDKASAEVITNEITQGQENVAKLTDLLNQASTTDEVKAALTTQIGAIQAQITRLQSVASSQAKLWGLFSWRF